MPDKKAESESALDLVLTRVVRVPRKLIWKAWTEPKHLMKWMCPLPWKTVECEIDLRPGGGFLTFEDAPGGTRYTARAMHVNAEDTKKHADMGFHDGWGKALDQLVAMAGELKG